MLPTATNLPGCIVPSCRHVFFQGEEVGEDLQSSICGVWGFETWECMRLGKGARTWDHVDRNSLFWPTRSKDTTPTHLAVSHCPRTIVWSYTLLPESSLLNSDPIESY